MIKNIIKIRESTTEDIHLIHQAHEGTFDKPEGTVFAKLACDTLQDKTAYPLLSLVAEDDNDIVGNIFLVP
jgi:predicted N-acetyltransferase YhbS